MWTRDQITEAAADLYESERTGIQTGLMSLRHAGLDLDTAYRVQDALVARKFTAGLRQIGWKIGLTSKAMQDALKIDTPDSGVLFDDMLFQIGSTVPEGRFIQPRIEAEIAFVMRRMRWTCAGSERSSRATAWSRKPVLVPVS